MNLKTESRRYFVFDNPDKWIFENNGIEGTEEGIKFPRCYPDRPNDPVNHDNRLKWVFSTVDECLKWYEANTMKFTPGKRIIKTVHNVQTKSVDITDEDWSLMQKRMRSPEKFDRKDFRVFEDWLANNWRDRDRERFPKKFLETLNRTIPGKQRIIGHQWGSGGYGRYFKSRIQQLGIDEALEFIGEHAVGKMKEHLEHIEERDGGLYVMVPSFYMRISGTTEEQIADIDAGIGGDSSIGFRADGRESIKDEDGNVMYTEYIDTGTSESMEGSDVWLGSQRGSQIKKDADDDEIEEKVWTSAYINTLEDNCFAICESNDARHLPHHAKGDGASGINGKVDIPQLLVALAKLDQIEPVTKKMSIERLRSKATSHLVAHAKKLGIGEYDSYGGQTMKVKLESLGIQEEIELEEDSISKFTGIVEGKAAEIVNENVTLHETVKTVKDIFGNDLSAEALMKFKLQAEDGVKRHGDLVNEVNKFKLLLGLVENTEENVKADKEFLGTLNSDQLKAQLDQFKTRYSKDHPGTGILPDNVDETKNKKKEDECELDICIL